MGGVRMGPVPQPAIGRFMKKVEITPGGCWMWTATLHKGGYGQFYFRGRTAKAHRWSYEYFVGPIPEGMEVDHVCHSQDLTCAGGPTCLHRACVNPEHLEVVTPRENRRRGRGGDNHRGKTHCPKGHPYNDENTYLRPRGGRSCRTCLREMRRRYKEGRHVE